MKNSYVVKDDLIELLRLNSKNLNSQDEDSQNIERINGSGQITKKERQIKSQKELITTIIENISEAFAIYNKQGELITMNAVAKELYPEKMAREKVYSVYEGYEYFDLDGNVIPFEDNPTQKALRGEWVKNAVIVIKTPKKNQITEINASPIFDEHNQLILVAVLHRDITESLQNHILIKKQQEEMLQKEKEKREALLKVIEMKDDFLSLISHEFKTPLAVINSAIQAMELLCGQELSYKAKDYLNKIRQNANRQLKLVNNLLDITRMDAGHLTIDKVNRDIIALTQSITESIKIFAEQKGIEISFCSSINEKIMGIDEEKYERILLNLLSNAVKYTPKGSLVKVIVSPAVVNKKHQICIQVKDNGRGIPDDKQSLIFERFGQADNSLARQAEGTGIGLYLVKMLVEKMDGEITLESKEGVGSTFTVLLPAKRVKESVKKQMIDIMVDDRLIKATAIEFSDVYFS
ncbi:MAG: putative sensor kinase [Clostridia bacterium]|jgi:signal transduction histidine kinase|nr:putative sensor kinase [Clostridia bacterium]